MIPELHEIHKLHVTWTETNTNCNILYCGQKAEVWGVSRTQAGFQVLKVLRPEPRTAYTFSSRPG